MELLVIKLADAVCNTTDAHCEYCRSENGPKLWAQWAKVFDMPAMPDGCPRKLPMGWKKGDPKRPTTRRPRRVPLSIVVPPEVAGARLSLCGSCASNEGGTCAKQKASCGGRKPASIETGVWMPRAHCPDDRPKWGRWPGLVSHETTTP